MSDEGASRILLAHLFDQSGVSGRMRVRLNLTAERLGKNPQLSLPQALGGAGYKGLMRALSNPRVQQDQLFDAVYAATLERFESGQDVICIEDTTDLISGEAWAQRVAAVGRLRHRLSRSHRTVRTARRPQPGAWGVGRGADRS